MKLGYIQVKDHPLSISLRNNYQRIVDDYIRLSSKYISTKTNNVITSTEVNQKESTGKMLYQGTIQTIFTRVVPESCSKPEIDTVFGTTEESRKKAEIRFVNKQLLSPAIEEILKPYSTYLGSVGFNIMTPSTKLTMHYGVISKYVRFHMGIICDPNATFHVEDYPPRAWEAGKVWAFDDGGAYHGTIHDGTIDRVILLLDIDRAAFDTLEEETSWC
jgi:hypothetical protein